MKLNLIHLKKTVALCFVILFLATALKAQTIKNNLIVMGVVDSVQSKILNETRKLWVYVPKVDSTFLRQKYPVVYLLDGDSHFPSVTGMLQQLGVATGNSQCPDMIVVAIPNTDRMRDLTTNSIPALKTSGGGEKFTSFIEKELMPHIDSIYPTNSYKIIIGHSLGGMMVINTLVNHPNMFNGYIAIDPSMWWDRGILLNQAREALKQKKYSDKKLFVGIANTMPKGMDTTQARKDTSAATNHIRAILKLKDMIQSDTAVNRLKFAYKYYPNETHGSLPLITEYDALRFFFTNYAFPQETMMKIYGKDSSPELALAEVQSHYDNISKQMGFKVALPEGVINNFGISLIARNLKMAFAFLQLNIKNYPNSYNVYDSMGDYYDAAKDKTKAIEFYRKALTLKEFPDTRSKLNKLLALKDTAPKK
ncbi:esterase [Pedobacter sp. KBW06]|uniref:alpha/beta hydrolase-fold protein n=1 Tax=Pedobacter sp. KBW06 TaxID=2153359 RepID=UPI000F594C5F|nr:alpha/beta hydrolase-fold protein [Pedobacter sp. KBW06]RQO74387.1 esterase [Pedobacter sp. KBW06]